MGRSQETFNKKEKEKKKRKKREEKAKKKEERKANSSDGGWESMIAYVDENGRISDTPPDPTIKKKEVDAESITLGVPKKEVGEDDHIKKGAVAFFNHDKGYGFIKSNDSHEKYFVHVNGLNEPIQEGDKVQFEIEKGQKGWNAVNVSKT